MHNYDLYPGYKSLSILNIYIYIFCCNFSSPNGQLGLGRYGSFTIPSALVLYTSYIRGFIKIYAKLSPVCWSEALSVDVDNGQTDRPEYYSCPLHSAGVWLTTDIVLHTQQSSASSPWPSEKVFENCCFCQVTNSSWSLKLGREEQVFKSNGVH